MPAYSIHDPIRCETQDTLQRRYLAERIFKRLSSEACRGMTGIYGGWGAGKTSLLDLIQEKWQKSADKTLPIESIDARNAEGVDLTDAAQITFSDHHDCVDAARAIQPAANCLRPIGLP